MGPARRQPHAGWRVLLALVVVMAGAATTTVVFARGQFDQLASALGTNKSVRLASGTLAPAGFGGPQTLLLIGNDQRKHTTTNPVLPHANEMLLVRIDPGKPWISMMSIPRELQVPIHTPSSGIVTTRLNAALFYGGIGLVVSTIKQVTGLSVNHVVVIDFGNFVRAVNEIGCVYGTIDRRYYHVNVPGGPQYFQVNLQPGYQKLCGEQALQFVTYRHDDTSLERDARDQDFLLEVKQQYGPTLIDNIAKFEHIFGQTVQTDPSLHTANGVESLVGTLISVASRPVRQVKFQANLGGQTDCACVTATPQQIHASVNSFLNGKGLPPAKKSTAALARRLHHRTDTVGFIQAPATDISKARALARRMHFPLEFPSVEVNNGDGLATAFRGYSITAPGGHSYPIYVAVFSTGLLGQYYDVQGTTWLTAPMFDNPDQAIKVGGRTYYVYYSGQHIKTLAWFANGVAYWVQNTLTFGLSNAQMLTTAEHTAPVIGAAAGSVRRDERHQDSAPSTVTVISAAGSPLETVGRVAAVLTMLAVLGGLGQLWLRHTQTRTLSSEAGLALGRLTALDAHLAHLAGTPVRTGLLDEEPAEARLRGLLIAAAVSVALTLAGVGLVMLLTAPGSAAGAGRTTPRTGHAVALTAPIAVLNGGTVQGAAGRLARSLRREHLDVLGAANLGSVAPAGYEVLYTAGQRGQAVALSKRLASHHPIVAPIDPAAQAAAGQRARVVVVIP